MIYKTIPLRDGDENIKMTTYIIEDPLTENRNHKARSFPMVVICPGGAYEFLSHREAEPIALQFNAAGMHAVVVDYSLKSQFPRALEDVSKAIVTVREHADEWHVDPDRIFVCGFSAGGHLAASMGIFWNQEPSVKRGDQMNKPNGMILAYPVITSDSRYMNKTTIEHATGGDPAFNERVSLEKNVTSDCAPAFIWHTFTDTCVPVQNSYLLANALCEKGISTEMHIYPRGVHGLSLASDYTAADCNGIIPEVQGWVKMAIDWIRSF